MHGQIYIKWYICHGACFDLVGHRQALQENRSKSCLIFLHCGIPNAHKFQLQTQKYIRFHKLKLLCDCLNLKLETYPFEEFQIILILSFIYSDFNVLPYRISL